MRARRLLFQGTFTSDKGGDAGTWIGGKGSIDMYWKAGAQVGQAFTGNWDASKGIYKGTVFYLSITQKGLLLHEAAGGC